MTARRVLVIDDSPTIHKVIDRTLTQLGIEVAHVRDGETGIAKAKEFKPDVILLDFTMPGMNGYQVCKALAELDDFQHIPIILMSAKGELIGEKLVKTMGIVDYITKPFTPDAVATVTQHAIEKHLSAEAVASADEKPLMLVGERSPEDSSTSEDLSDPRGQPALRGDLGMIPPGEVFQLLKFQTHTGILHLARGKAHLEAHLRDGEIVFARARNVDDEFLLGRFLIEVGAISPRDLELFLQSRHGTSKLMGGQLIKLGHISEENLALALRRQTEALLYEVIRWGDGAFAFYVTDNLPVEARDASLSLSIDQVLLEGFRRVDEWGMIEKEIRDFDAVLAPCQDSTGVMKQVELDPEEERILALVDGRRDVRQIIRSSHRSSFDVCKVLFRLLSSRIVRKRSRTEPLRDEVHS